MKNVVIVDYGMGNIDSVARAIEECGGKPIITNAKKDFEIATHIILPGVGSFQNGMKNIRSLDIDKILQEQVIEYNIPFLGICLGMQLLATKGYEGGETDGLGFIEGEVSLMKPLLENEKIPHIGWNEVYPSKDTSLFEGIESGKDFYFVHSYHFQCNNEDNVYATTPYCDKFISVIGKNNIMGVQFHPEKSQKTGFKLLKNFLNG